MSTGKCINKPKVSIIVATLLPDFGIGYKGQLPWSLKQEMKYFRKLTTATIDQSKKNAVIMGRKTYYSIPPKFRPLKGRMNIVLSRNIEKLKEEIEEELDANKEILRVSNSLPQVLETLTEADQIEEIFIIGGAEVYNQLMAENHSLIDSIYLTEVSHPQAREIDMDSFFNLNMDKWEKCDHEKLHNYLERKGLHMEFNVSGNEENDFRYDFTLWEKR